MKFSPFKFFILISIVVSLGSCLGTTTNTTTYSSNPCFSSLVFKTNDSIPHLSSAVFTLQYDATLNDSVIVNVDSLPYKTRIDSVYPTFNFISSAGAKLFFKYGYKYNKDSAVISGTDTIDFRQPVVVKNYAADGKTYKRYTIKVNVHSVDPEVYNWNQASDNLNSINATSQKTITRNDTLFYYLNDGTKSYLYLSTNGTAWNEGTVNGLPESTPLTDMIQFKGKIYLSRDGLNLYSSSNGLDWVKKSVTDFKFRSLLYVMNGQLWAVVQSVSDASFHFATSNDGAIWSMTAGTVPSTFPVSDFAAVTFNETTGKEKALVIGGISATGDILNNRWSTEDGAYWVDYRNENVTLDTLAVGASVISYDGKLFVYGSRTDNGMNYYKVSKDEGLSWKLPDTLRNVLPLDLKPRTYQSMVVFRAKTYDKVNTASLKDEILKSNRIFIIGGKSATTIYSDVWTGKLTRKNFLRQ